MSDAHAPSPPSRIHDDTPASSNHQMPELPRLTPGKAVIMVALLTGATASAFLLGWIPHARKLEAAREEARRVVETLPVVEVVAPKPASIDETLTLPADVRANQSTAIFARATGYLKPFPPGIDIGAHVTAGQVIAEISAPEIDAQLLQSRAAVEQAKAAVVRAEHEHALSESTLRRWESAGAGEAVTPQELDERRSQEKTTAAALDGARANVDAAEATLRRFTELQAFEKVTAPFDGVLTSRGFDAGALIDPAEANGSRELFRIADTSVLRVQVNVPQTYATDVRPGQAAELLVRNFPKKVFPGTVARSAGAIDAATRTLRVEIEVPNKEGTLLPGMYGQVRIQCHRPEAPLIVPASSLVIGPEGVRVGTVDDGVVRLRPVSLGRDLGAEVEVATGLGAADSVLVNPGVLTDGTRVTVLKR